MNCILRKVILRTLNNLLSTYKTDVEAARNNVRVWLLRADAVTAFLSDLSLKLDDSNLTEEELESIVERFKQIVENWKQ